MHYRPEIDGLRAVAVLPVILFHAGIPGFSGGFVGVDVFFVISGYLITSILIKDLDAGNFSLTRFYERRARRILPALSFVMLCCLPFAWAWMIPTDLANFGQSLIAVSVFASNILFWKESSYFAAAAEEKPLLHTWSLAVEEQFYLLFPLVIWALWRFGRQPIFWLIVLVTGASLALSELGWRFKPDANFYLIPTRAWELMIGALCALSAARQKPSHILGLVGLGMILAAIVIFDKSTPFPSLYALVPVIGTALVIQYGGAGSLAGRLLSLKLMVAIGLISYSAYLWHQPLFAFARLRLTEAPSLEVLLILSALSLVLAAFSWRFVEQPFRRKDRILIKSKRYVFLISALISFIFIGIGSTLYVTKGVPRSIPVEIRAITDTAPYTKDYHICAFGEKSDIPVELEACLASVTNPVVLYGDSHAESISFALREALAANGRDLISFTHKACLPIAGTERVVGRAIPACRRFTAQVQEALGRIAYDRLILSARWALNYHGGRFDNGEGGIEYGVNGAVRVAGQSFTTDAKRKAQLLDHMRTEITKHSRTLIHTQIPEAGWHVPRLYTKYALFGAVPKANNIAQYVS